MDRRNFIKTSAIGTACVSVAACNNSIKQQSFPSNGENELLIPRALLNPSKPYVLMDNPGERYPICLYQISSDEYIASIMDCSHQHCETAPNNEGYICPCHGARYDKFGAVVKGPAIESLQTLITVVDELHVRIKLA